MLLYSDIANTNDSCMHVVVHHPIKISGAVFICCHSKKIQLTRTVSKHVPFGQRTMYPTHTLQAVSRVVYSCIQNTMFQPSTLRFLFCQCWCKKNEYTSLTQPRISTYSAKKEMFVFTMPYYVIHKWLSSCKVCVLIFHYDS